MWEQNFDRSGGVDLRQEVHGLAAAAKQVGVSGTAEQRAQAAEIIAEARKGLYRLLAE